MNYKIRQLNKAPDRVAMSDLLAEYYDVILGQLKSLGGPDIDPDELVQDFWDHLPQFLPPEGCLLVAEAEDGTWLGTGALRRLPENRGELKRLFVRKEARGTGLGRRLVTDRIEIARQMGLKSLFVDTLTTTIEMQSLYGSLGFREIPPYAESATYVAFPAFAEYMLFFSKDLD